MYLEQKKNHHITINTLCIIQTCSFFKIYFFCPCLRQKKNKNNKNLIFEFWPVVSRRMACVEFPCEQPSCLLPQAVIQSSQQLGLFLCHRQASAECSAQDASPVLSWQQAWCWQRGRWGWWQGGRCSCLCCQVLQGAHAGCCCAAAFAWRQVCSEEKAKFCVFKPFSSVFIYWLKIDAIHITTMATFYSFILKLRPV